MTRVVRKRKKKVRSRWAKRQFIEKREGRHTVFLHWEQNLAVHAMVAKANPSATFLLRKVKHPMRNLRAHSSGTQLVSSSKTSKNRTATQEKWGQSILGKKPARENFPLLVFHQENVCELFLNLRLLTGLKSGYNCISGPLCALKL